MLRLGPAGRVAPAQCVFILGPANNSAVSVVSVLVPLH